MTIEFNTLSRLCNRYAEEYKAAVNRVIDSAWFVLGNELSSFEKKFAEYCGVKYCVGLNSGLDALALSLRALNIGVGDEVIVPANTYIATVLAITENHAIPIFVEPDEYYCIDADKIEEAITPKTKAIMPVHLYGQVCDIASIVEIADKYNLKIVEDCAQSHAALFGQRMTGTFGCLGCYSFYPTKNLGAFGDSGAVITNDESLAEKLRAIRNYGSKVKYINEIEGVNSRLDEMQAAILSVQLSHIDELTAERIEIANRYIKGIDNKDITLPLVRSDSKHVFHLFAIRSHARDALQQYLNNHAIKTQIHYPVPPHLADCYKSIGYSKGDFLISEELADTILSLPLYYGMTDEEIDYVIDVLNGWKG